MFGAAVSALLTGFAIGLVARFALPGPDPMPLWLTMLIGLGGSAAGGGIAAAIFGADHTYDTSSRIFVTLLLEIGAAILLVAAYRRLVQHRPLTGPDAYRFPTRGAGIARMRERLHRLGIDPDRIGRAGSPAAPTERPPDEVAESLEKLRELRERGVLTEEEYERARERLRRY